MQMALRSVLLLLLLWCLAYDVQAQYTPFFMTGDGEPKHTFYGGIAVGANFSQVDGDGFSGYHKVGLNIGPLVYARITDFVSASLEIIYTQKGSKERDFQETSSGVPYLNAYDLKLNYIEVPVLAHLSLRRFQYGAGLAYGFLLSSREEATTVNPVNLYPDLYSFRKTDLSGLGEVGYEFYKGTFIQMRYSYSLATIRDADRIPEGYGGGRFSRQLNNMFSLRLVYLVK